MDSGYALDLGRVTAGLPGLTPQLRFGTENTHLQKHRSREALLQKLEREAAAADVLDGDTDTNLLAAQLGRPLTSQQLEQRLRKCNPDLMIERSIADATKSGVYCVRDGEKRFICGMEAGYMPEFSVRHVTTEEIPDPDIEGHWIKRKKFTGETRGWRTVLARLLRAGHLQPGEIERWFEISKGRSSQRWQILTT